MTDTVRSALETAGGLDRREALVYLTLLDLGEASVQTIASKARLERTGTYDILARLAVRQLVRVTTAAKRTRFRVESPARLRDSLAGRLDRLDRLVPDLLARYERVTRAPALTHYHGSADVLAALLGWFARCQRGALVRAVFATVEFADLVAAEAALAPVAAHIRQRQLHLRLLTPTVQSVRARTWAELLPIDERRVLPVGVAPPVSQYSTAESVLSVAAEAEPFAVELAAPALAAQSIVLFDTLWRSARPPRNRD